MDKGLPGTCTIDQGGFVLILRHGLQSSVDIDHDHGGTEPDVNEHQRGQHQFRVAQELQHPIGQAQLHQHSGDITLNAVEHPFPYQCDSNGGKRPRDDHTDAVDGACYGIADAVQSQCCRETDQDLTGETEESPDKRR